jgi:hypothetical protein
MVNLGAVYYCYLSIDYHIDELDFTILINMVIVYIELDFCIYDSTISIDEPDFWMHHLIIIDSLLGITGIFMMTDQ